MYVCVTIIYMDQSCNCDEKYPLILCTIFYEIPIINLFIDMTNNLCVCASKKLPSRATLAKGDSQHTQSDPSEILWRMVNSLDNQARLRIDDEGRKAATRESEANENIKLLHRMKILLIFFSCWSTNIVRFSLASFNFFFVGKPSPYSCYNNLIDYSWLFFGTTLKRYNTSCSLRLLKSVLLTQS